MVNVRAARVTGPGHSAELCTQFNDGADRCLPYRNEVVPFMTVILRARKQEAVYLFIDTRDTHVRVRYAYGPWPALDSDGIVSGKLVRSSEVIGKVGNYNNGERGTTYHLHFDMQVPTSSWVFVSPYDARLGL